MKMTWPEIWIRALTYGVFLAAWIPIASKVNTFWWLIGSAAMGFISGYAGMVLAYLILKKR